MTSGEVKIGTGCQDRDKHCYSERYRLLMPFDRGDQILCTRCRPPGLLPGSTRWPKGCCCFYPCAIFRCLPEALQVNQQVIHCLVALVFVFAKSLAYDPL